MAWQTVSALNVTETLALQRTFLARVYRWMFLGLGVTAFTAWFVARTPALANPILASPGLQIGLWVGELALVWFLAARASSLKGSTAGAMFFVYALLNGLSFSALFFRYNLGSAAAAFLATALMFGVMSFFGAVTKRDLSGWSSFLFMGLIGVIIASVVNIFLASGALSFVLTCATLVVFIGLTAYDTQKLRALAAQVEGGPSAESLSVVGALELYLDFINIFLALLRLMSSSSRR